jgi:flagellar protein FliO/FliZ
MDYAAYSQFVLALVFVLALIGVLSVLGRRLGFGGVSPAGGAQSRRVHVIEVRPLDAKHKLVLLRRDQVEHLVIVGPTSETVIESGIAAPDRTFAGALRDSVPGSAFAAESKR